MYARQKQVLESFVRVRTFLEDYPATGWLTYSGARETLDEVLQRAFAHAGTQVSGPALHRGESSRQRHLMGRIRDRHMRPIVTIARAQIEPGSDVGLPVALRMPKVRLGVTLLLQACDGMMAAAVPFAEALIAHGLPSDFLARFEEAREELDRTRSRRAELTQSHIGARAGLAAELRRGRRAVDRLDAVVRVAFEGDEVVLTAWRSAKRVRLLPGARRTRELEPADEPGLRLAA
ncbi:MAG: hypothetical protein JNL44_03005 [Gemmatimonadetes bacterium]|nr:hypothetical protein [Gemmatimonadota bacterium]